MSILITSSASLFSKVLPYLILNWAPVMIAVVAVTNNDDSDEKSNNAEKETEPFDGHILSQSWDSCHSAHPAAESAHSTRTISGITDPP